MRMRLYRLFVANKQQQTAASRHVLPAEQPTLGVAK